MKRKAELISINKLMILAVIFVLVGFRHPIHVTVMEVEFDKKSKAIEMSIHVFSDDLEKQLRTLRNDENLEIMEVQTGKRDQMLSEYFRQMVTVKANDREYTIDYIGHETEGEAIWVYAEVSNIKKVKTLEVKNNTLLDLYKDQVNLVHFEYEGEVYSQKIDHGNKSATYDINNL